MTPELFLQSKNINWWGKKYFFTLESRQYFMLFQETFDYHPNTTWFKQQVSVLSFHILKLNILWTCQVNILSLIKHFFLVFCFIVQVNKNLIRGWKASIWLDRVGYWIYLHKKQNPINLNQSLFSCLFCLHYPKKKAL